MRNSWRIMLNNGKTTEIKLKTLLLLRKSNDLDLRGKVRMGLCDAECCLVISCLGLNVNVLFCATLCAYTFLATAHLPCGISEKSKPSCRQ